MNILEKSLFETSSIKIAPADKPFWYTSGTIGPYFINTHFLYGGEKEAIQLLDFINQNKNDHFTFINRLADRIISFYDTNKIFKDVIDTFYNMIKNIPGFINSSYISGGERRDWFFSPIIAHLSNKKLLYIYKDLKVYSHNVEIHDLNGLSVSHICDLVTKASSFQRAWIPAIQNVNGRITFTAGIVDRNEGGNQIFKKNNIAYFSAVKIDNSFLNNILKNNIINQNQLNLINNFKNDPIKFGNEFINMHHTFFVESIQNNSTCSKAITCYNDNPLNIDFKSIIEEYPEIKKTLGLFCE